MEAIDTMTILKRLGVGLFLLAAAIMVTPGCEPGDAPIDEVISPVPTPIPGGGEGDEFAVGDQNGAGTELPGQAPPDYQDAGSTADTSDDDTDVEEEEEDAEETE